jgi:hypothetical protein
MPLLGNGKEEPVKRLYEPNLKTGIKNNEGPEQDIKYLEEQVQPKLEMAKQICEDELLHELPTRFFSIAKAVVDKTLSFLEEHRVIDRASIKSNSNMEAQMMNVILDGYALSLLHKRLDGKPYEESGELFIKNSYFTSVKEMSKLLYQVYGKPWEEILATPRLFHPGKSKAVEVSKFPAFIKPLNLIEHLVYSGFYFGMITHYGL